jgi:hypothetical protein
MSVVALLVALAAAPAENVESKEANLAQCAWQEAATSAATLVAQAKFDKRYVYDADGSPTVGPLLRIRAACWGFSKAYYARTGESAGDFDDRKFLRRLAASRPRDIAPDRFDGIVRRCEYQYLDAPEGARPAAVIWSFETDGVTQELNRSEQIEGFAAASELLAAISPGNSGSQLVARAQRYEPLRVATIEAGRASGRGFAVDTTAGRRSCRIVKPDGSYEDA